ncbi:MAG: hypothetical protein C0456_15525 [Hyphomonas sp.]|uniref:hypothetical protein n=1 Tax=Hyphomonas sp. TaxID=87 RepID=UPI001DFBF96A|nr:hypothetical protein [Hyphomonas sp.]MBA4228032.1 hypothetical protein [Hyphomonas sp.]
MSETRDFLKQRRLLLERKIALLNAELEEVRLAERALENIKSDRSERQLPLMTPGFVTLAPALVPTQSPLTIKDKIVRVMFRAQKPLSSRAILKLIHQHYGDELPRTSFSPQISRLKQEGRVQLNKELKKYELTPKETQRLQDQLK